ncbi:hypothetical protein ACOBQX_24000 [Actinokineospora sp. G85]|uniref:hypothetical protein n=1 Tax=Actinokineospora sp. G85 TaxID=3406626 RepID=UPI003C782C46
MFGQRNCAVGKAWDRFLVAALAALTERLSRIAGELIEKAGGEDDACPPNGEPGCKRHRPPIGVVDIDTHLSQLIEFSEQARQMIESEELTSQVVEEIDDVSANVLVSCRWIVAHTGGPVTR